jgi:pimeloyl-ACP methyl ester carboxylesterase
MMKTVLCKLAGAGLMLWALAGASAQAASTCRVEVTPPKTLTQQIAERVLWGKWENFEENYIHLDDAASPPLIYHALVKRPGPPNPDQPLIVFLHGFPEFDWAWEAWLKQFGNQYDAVAIDLKGYGQSTKPTPLDAYQLPQLVDELDRIVTCMGYKQVIPVGHDWGGTLAWVYSLYHPERTKALVVLSTPHPYTFFRELAKPGSDQRQKSHYIDLIRANTPQSMLEFGGFLLQEKELWSTFYTGPRALRLLNNMDSLYKLNRMLSYYRVLDFPPSPADYPDVPTPEALARFTVRAPTLAFYGKTDRYFSPDSWRGVRQFVPKLDFREVDGGHFIAHSVPGLSDQTLDFIDVVMRGER